MKIYLFAQRNTKEILRDPINFFFALGFPLILLGLLSAINASIPAEAGNTMFEINTLTPGLAAFGAVFMSLFSGTLLAKDRTSSFLLRLFTSPMTSLDFILGYTLPMIIMTVIQSVITFLAAGFFGLPLNGNSVLAIVVIIPISLLYVGLGLLCGSLLNDKAVGGICGALLTNITGWLSGVFIPLDLIGGTFKATAAALPFYHCSAGAQAALSGAYSEIWPHLAVVAGYVVVIYTVAVLVFRYKMNSDKT